MATPARQSGIRIPNLSAQLHRYAIPTVIVLLCGLGLVGSAPHLAGAYHLEAGGRALAEARLFAAAHPGTVNPALDRALRHFERAVRHLPDNGDAYRRWGQAWLLAGDNLAASHALSRAAELCPNHPLIYLELGYAYDGLGKVEDALAEYERGGYGPMAEAAIVNYLKAADWQIGATAEDDALDVLERKVLALDEDSLPALYRMMRLYESMDPPSAQNVRERLRALPDEGIALPTEPRLIAYVEQTVTALVAEGVWTREQADRVLAR
jgi:tetratricopeptide (TPR) repeat protein